MDTVVIKMFVLQFIFIVKGSVRFRIFTCKFLLFSANSVAKWEALLQDIANIECFSTVSQSLAHKLFSQREKDNIADLQAKVCSV